MNFALKGTFLHGNPLVEEEGYLIIQDGVIKEWQYHYEGDFPVMDHSGCIIVPGLCDMHVHAPQYPARGFGMDLPLLPWLEAYTFPQESMFDDLSYARQVYAEFVRDLVRNGTTRAAVFGTIHTDATLLLMQMLEDAGVCALVGKVNMDRNAPDSLCERDSMGETFRWLEACQDFRLVQPIITPRFIPSCTPDLLTELGRLAGQRGLRVQSHLSESESEVQWVRALEPDCDFYARAYQKYGLLHGSVMAHCVQSSPQERELLREEKVLAVHCPDSNINLASGIAPMREMLQSGVRVALGSDIAGGHHLNLLDVMAVAVRASKLRGTAEQILKFEEAFEMGTSGGAAYFGAEGGFAGGSKLHAVVLWDKTNPRTLERHGAKERLQRLAYCAEQRETVAVYGEGKLLYAVPDAPERFIKW